MTISAGGNDITNQYGLDTLNQSASNEVATPFSELVGETPGSNFEGLSTRPPPSSEPPRPEGMPPKDLVWGVDIMPQAEVDARVEAFLADVDSPLETALYSNPEAGMSQEGWAAVREFAGDKMSAALDVVGKFLEPDAEVQPSQEDLVTLGMGIVVLNAVEGLQERLGLENTPQGQLVSIASSSMIALSNGIAGAMADPIAGKLHLAELHSGFSSVAQVMENPTKEQLDTWEVGSYNVEIYSSDIVQGIVSDAVLSDLGVPQLLDGSFDPAFYPTAAEINAHPLAQDIGFTILVNPEFGSNIIDPGAQTIEQVMEMRDERLASGGGFIDFELSEYIGVDGSVESETDEEEVEETPEQAAEQQEDGPVVPDGDPSFLDAELGSDDEADEDMEPEEEPVVAVVEDEVSEGEATENGSGSSELGFGDSPLWRPISVDFQRLEDSASDIDTIFSDVVANLDNLEGQDLLFDTPLMANFTIFLEDLGATLENITLQEAQEISGVASSLATDLFDGMAALDAAGLGDTPAFAAAEVLGEVLSSVFYAGEIAEKAPQVGADLMNDYIQPFVSGLGEVFGRAAESYADTGVVDASIQQFLRQARDMARDLYVTVFNLNTPEADEPDVDADTTE